MTNQRRERIVEPPDFDRPFLPEAVFSDDIVLVTGGSSGMGRGMALAFAQGGAKLAIVGRDIQKARAVAAEIEAMGETALAIAADVRDAAQVSAAFDAAEAALGPVSILANNAGGNFPALAEALSTNAWNAITQIAIDGTFLCSSEFARRRMASALPGAIVNNSAQYIWTGFPGDAHSAAAKAAVATLTRALASDCRPHDHAGPGTWQPEDQRQCHRARQYDVRCRRSADTRQLAVREGAGSLDCDAHARTAG